MNIEFLLPPDGDYPAVAGGYISTFQWSVYVYQLKFPNGVRGVNIPDTITVKGNQFTSATLGAGGQLGERKSGAPVQTPALESIKEFAEKLLDMRAYSIRIQFIDDRKQRMLASHPEYSFLEELAAARTLDKQSVILHRLLANFHLAKIDEIIEFIQRKRG